MWDQYVRWSWYLKPSVYFEGVHRVLRLWRTEWAGIEDCPQPLSPCPGLSRNRWAEPASASPILNLLFLVSAQSLILFPDQSEGLGAFYAGWWDVFGDNRARGRWNGPRTPSWESLKWHIWNPKWAVCTSLVLHKKLHDILARTLLGVH